MLSPNDLSVFDHSAAPLGPPVTTDVWPLNRGSNLNHEPVLIVEDERVSRRALSALLACYGYPTQAVASAEEALQILNQPGHPGIVLVDLDLPGMSGLDLIERLSHTDPSLAMVMITAARREGLAAELAHYGAAYLSKPLNFDVLLGLLAEIDQSRGLPDKNAPLA